MDSLLARRLGSVPELVDFPFVDELVGQARRLAESYPEVASIARVGSSRLGEPIEALRVTGDGPLEALVFGGVHPNEPIGGLTALHLAESLCTDPELRHGLGYSWTVIPCIDPDGMRLNEGWFKGPFAAVIMAGTSIGRPRPNKWSGHFPSNTRRPISTA